MKKWFVLLLALFLSACDAQTFDINATLAETLGNTQNFTVTETFNFKQYAITDDVTFNKTIQSDAEIRYHRGLIYTNKDYVIESELSNEVTRTVNDYESYVDVFRNLAYIKTEDTWYEVELRHLIAFDMGSIDPIDIINSILYDSTETYYKTKDGSITGNAEDYRILVAKLPSEVFEPLFSSTIFEDIDIRYDYDVTVTLTFDDNYQVTSIGFNLDDLLGQYRDFITYEEKVDVTSLSMDYELSFTKIGETAMPKVEEVTDWIVGTTDALVMDELLPFKTIESSATAVYSLENTSYLTDITIQITDSYRYMYYEIYFILDGEVVNTYYSENYDVEPGELTLYYGNLKERVDDIIVQGHVIHAFDTTIESYQMRVSLEGEQAFLSNYDDFIEFEETTSVVEAYVLTDDAGAKLYLYANNAVEDVSFTLYLFDELLVGIYRDEETGLLANEVKEYEIETEGFTEAFIDLNYDITFAASEHIKLIPVVLQTPSATKGLNLNVTETYNPNWLKYQYSFDADVSFRGFMSFYQDGKLLGSEFVNGSDQTALSHYYVKADQIIFTGLVDETRGKWIVTQ